MRRIIAFMSIALIYGLLLNSGCGLNALTGGTSTSENGRVVGKILSIGGVPAPQTQVTLFPVDYDPVKDRASIPVDTTDALGNYAFTQIASGDYTILAVHIDNRTRTLITGIHVADDTITAPTNTLLATGSMKVMPPDSANILYGYLYVPGTTVFAFLNNRTGFVVLDSVPAGVVPVIAYSSTNIETPTTIRYDVPVASGDTISVWNPAWNHARTLILNTAPNGANIAGMVVDFPVLVRLTGSNFAFAQAKSGGADLRFTKPDNTFLPYEIERWDSAGQAAEIWVNVDTVQGNNNRQYIVMYWGNSSAADRSSGAAVFSTSNGFQGVWHLGDNSTTTAYDATANRFDGTPSTVAPIAATGNVGMARRFDGASNSIKITGTAAGKLNFPKNGIYSVSAWVYADNVDGLIHTILSKGNQQYNFELKMYDWEFGEYGDRVGWEMTVSRGTAKTWAHLVGIRNGAKQYLFVNGSCVDSVFEVNPSPEARYTGYDVMIGKMEGIGGGNFPYFFKGILDEIRVSNVASSADWIRLSYMNQKAQDGLVVFK
jgi:hypothetical protein